MEKMPGTRVTGVTLHGVNCRGGIGREPDLGKTAYE